MVARGCSIIVALLLGVPGAGLGAAAAQETTVRAGLAGFRDSLAAVTDSAQAARLERRLASLIDAEEDAAARIRHGLAAMRHAELGNDYRFATARRSFRRAAELEPDWVWPAYAAALAHAAEFEAQVSDSLEIGKRIGVGHLNEAVSGLAAILAREPSFTPALLELERLAWRLREEDNWRTALDAFRAASARWATSNRSAASKMSDTPDTATTSEELRTSDTSTTSDTSNALPGMGRPAPLSDPAVLLALARLEREAGDPDSAVAALQRYAELGGSPGMMHLELARTRLQHGLPGGADAYFAGAAHDDSAAVAGYRADLALIVSDSVLADFDSAQGAERAAVLRRFWNDRARIDLREPEDRLREHYRRLQYVRSHFALSITRRHQIGGCPYRSGSMEVDDRGIIYLRHGEPTRRIRPVLFTVMPNESWRYDRADGDLIFHFGAGVDVHDYRLLSSASDVIGGCTLVAAREPPSMSDVWLSRQELDPMYARLSAWGGTGAGDRLAREERIVGAASIAVGTTTDSWQLRFEQPLDAVVDVVAVGRRGDRTIAHVVFGIGGGGAVGEPVAGGWRYPVRVRLAAYGADRRVVGYLDSTTAYVMPVRLDSSRQLFGRMELPLPAGTWTVRTAVDVAGKAGLVAPLDSVRVVSAAPAGDLRLSDLVVGWRAIRLTWPRAADTVYFSPFRSYRSDAELELYYEIYGLAPGSEYRTRLEIESREGGGLFRRRPPGVRLGFRDRATGGTASARRTVRLADLRPGPYWLDVIVSDEQGRSTRRRIGFDVDGPD